MTESAAKPERRAARGAASSRNLFGALTLVIATAAFSANDVLMKVIALRYPLGEVIFVRGVMTIVLVGTVLIAMGHTRALRFTTSRLVLLRAGLEAAAVLLFLTALLNMRVAEVSALVLFSPILITVMSIFFLGEVVRWRRWSAIIIGFVGVILVSKPVPSEFNAWAILGLATAMVAATRDVLTSRMGKEIPSIVISFTAAVSVTGAGLLLGTTENWQWMDSAGLALTTAAAVLVGFANFLIVLAFRDVDMSVVAPFRFTLLVWASLGGFLAFGEIPDRWTLSGGALIVGSGCYLLHREATRRRQAALRASIEAGESS